MIKKLALLPALLLPQIAFAHPGHNGHDIAGGGQFLSGLAHPIGGADHLLAMIALGLLAAQMGGRAVWALPLTFVGAMIAGGLAGYAGIGLPGIEPMILASVMVLGVLVAMAARLPLAALLPGAALFGLAHGWAHGAEGPDAGIAVYAAGFAVATMALHLVGIAAGRALTLPADETRSRGLLLRGLGGGTALAGLALAMVG